MYILVKPISIHSDPPALPVLTETSDYSYLSVKIWQVLLTRSSFSGREQKDNKLRALNHSPTPIMVYRILNYGSKMLHFLNFELSAGLKWLAIYVIGINHDPICKILTDTNNQSGHFHLLMECLSFQTDLSADTDSSDLRKHIDALMDHTAFFVRSLHMIR